MDSIIKIESEDYSRFHPPPPDIDPKDLPPSEIKDDKTLGNSYNLIFTSFIKNDLIKS